MNKEDIRRKVVGSLSRAQLENIDAKGEAVIEEEADAIMSWLAQTRADCEREKLKARYCEEIVCLRKVFPPYIYCDKHQDKSSTPVSIQSVGG